MPFSMLGSCYFLMLVLYLVGMWSSYFLASCLHLEAVCAVSLVYSQLYLFTQMCQLCHQLSVVRCDRLAGLLVRRVLAGVQ